MVIWPANDSSALNLSGKRVFTLASKMQETNKIHIQSFSRHNEFGSSELCILRVATNCVSVRIDKILFVYAPDLAILKHTTRENNTRESLVAVDMSTRTRELMDVDAGVLQLANDCTILVLSFDENNEIEEAFCSNIDVGKKPHFKDPKQLFLSSSAFSSGFWYLELPECCSDSPLLSKE